MIQGEPAGRIQPRWVNVFGLFALAFFVVAQTVGLLTSPPDADMGHLQKIMYVHVPAAWVAFLAFALVFGASVLYLWKRGEHHDRFAAASAEAGTVMTGLTLALGSIWGRPTWGVWWTWDARLTTTAILFLIFVSYLALRSFTEDEERRARWSAAVGILGFLNVPIVYMSVRWWRTLHQVQSTPGTVDAEYALSLRLNAFAFLFVFLWFVAVRYYTMRSERDVDAWYEERELARGGAHV